MQEEEATANVASLNTMKMGEDLEISADSPFAAMFSSKPRLLKKVFIFQDQEGNSYAMASIHKDYMEDCKAEEGEDDNI